MVLLSLGGVGLSTARIAVFLACHPATVRRWISRFSSAWVAGPADRPQLGGRLIRRIAAMPTRPGPWTLSRIGGTWADLVSACAGCTGLAGADPAAAQADRSRRSRPRIGGGGYRGLSCRPVRAERPECRLFLCLNLSEMSSTPSSFLWHRSGGCARMAACEGTHVTRRGPCLSHSQLLRWGRMHPGRPARRHDRAPRLDAALRRHAQLRRRGLELLRPQHQVRPVGRPRNLIRGFRHLPTTGSPRWWHRVTHHKR